MTCESCFNPSRACSHKSERNSQRTHTRARDEGNCFTRKLPLPKTQTGRQLCSFLWTHAGRDCSCVWCSSVLRMRLKRERVCGSERETVRVFKMLCLWAQSAALIIQDNSFLTSTSSHSRFRLLQRSHSRFCCNPYWKISPCKLYARGNSRRTMCATVHSCPVHLERRASSWAADEMI